MLSLQWKPGCEAKVHQKNGNTMENGWCWASVIWKTGTVSVSQYERWWNSITVAHIQLNTGEYRVAISDLLATVLVSSLRYKKVAVQCDFFLIEQPPSESDQVIYVRTQAEELSNLRWENYCSVIFTAPFSIPYSVKRIFSWILTWEPKIGFEKQVVLYFTPKHLCQTNSEGIFILMEWISRFTGWETKHKWNQQTYHLFSKNNSKTTKCYLISDTNFHFCSSLKTTEKKMKKRNDNYFE